MKRSFLKPSILVIAASAGSSQIALANEVMKLDELAVYGDTYRSTATKTSLRPEDTPQSISILDQQALEMRDADSVAAALDTRPASTQSCAEGP